MGSSVELSEGLKLKLIDAYKSGKGYKKISIRFGLSVSTVRNVINKWKLRGTVEVKPRSGRPKKISEKNANLLSTKAKENPHMTVKDLQEGLADTGVMVHLSTVKRCLKKQGVCRRRKPDEASSDKPTSEVCKGTNG